MRKEEMAQKRRDAQSRGATQVKHQRDSDTKERKRKVTTIHGNDIESEISQSRAAREAKRRSNLIDTSPIPRRTGIDMWDRHSVRCNYR